MPNRKKAVLITAGVAVAVAAVGVTGVSVMRSMEVSRSAEAVVSLQSAIDAYNAGVNARDDGSMKITYTQEENTGRTRTYEGLVNLSTGSLSGTYTTNDPNPSPGAPKSIVREDVCEDYFITAPIDEWRKDGCFYRDTVDGIAGEWAQSITTSFTMAELDFTSPSTLSGIWDASEVFDKGGWSQQGNTWTFTHTPYDVGPSVTEVFTVTPDEFKIAKTYTNNVEGRQIETLTEYSRTWVPEQVPYEPPTEYVPWELGE